MTDTYLENISPDSLSGMIFAFEGVKNTTVLLNGPTGCKFYHGATSDNQGLRQMAFDPHNYPALWYFGQPRVPATWLDSRDYVYGSEDKLSEGMTFVSGTARPELLVVVNSPGAALIGDDLEAVAARFSREPGGREDPPELLVVESPGYSRRAQEGYAKACRALIEHFCRGKDGSFRKGKGETRAEGRPSVNLLGISIFHKYWQGDLEEMIRLLGLCGIDVNCSLGCECSPEEIRRIPEADLNLVVDPDWGRETARFLEESLGMPWLCPEGQIIGFEQTEQFFREICEFLESRGRACSRSRLLEDSERARARSYTYLSRVNSLTGLPKGVRYALAGDPAQCLGYSRFLSGYFGMTADVISCVSGGDASVPPREESGISSGEKSIYETDAELVFADGNIIAALRGLGRSFTGVEISMPSLGYLDVIPKTHLGISGALLLCEQVLNGLRY